MANFLHFNASKPTIGSLATELLRRGVEPKQIPGLVRKVFPGSQIKMASVYWYASHAGIQLNRRSTADMAMLDAVLEASK